MAQYIALPRQLALPAAWLALMVGLAYAGVSIYWALGGTGLLDTVSASLAKDGQAHSLAAQSALWVAIVLKIIAAILPIAMLARAHRRIRQLAWVEAVILTGYGLVLTGAGLLVQTGVIDASANADHRALAWHTYLWDPWFLVWGALVLTALLATKRHTSPARTEYGRTQGRNVLLLRP